MPVGSKRLGCDFSAMRGARARRVKIKHIMAALETSNAPASFTHQYRRRNDPGHPATVALKFCDCRSTGLAAVEQKNSPARPRRSEERLAGEPPASGRDGALRRPRRVQRRNPECNSRVIELPFGPLNAGWDGAARRPCQPRRRGGRQTDSPVEANNLSSAARVKIHIRLHWIEIMRGALSGINGRGKDKQMRPHCSISGNTESELASAGADATDPAGALCGSSFYFVLLYLTGAVIFDNRHGLLKKLDSARAAKPLSQPLSHKSKC